MFITGGAVHAFSRVKLHQTPKMPMLLVKYLMN
jgi:hypothetical protein